MTMLLEQPLDSDFPPVTAGLDDEAILRRLELDDRNLEFDGENFVEKHVSVESCYVGGYIFYLFMTEALKTGETRVYGSELIYRCWPDVPRMYRKPDVSMVRTHRVAALGADPRVMTIPPDLAVEVISPTNTVDNIKDKLALYRRAGFGPTWVVHLPTRTLDIHRPDGTVEHLTAEDEIAAGTILPTFRRRVSELFGPPAPGAGY